MARKTVSRLEKRREAEAAEKLAADKKTPTKKATASATAKKKRVTKKSKKSKAANRRRLVWVIFSGAMKEEGRFPYEQRKEAEERLKQLRAKGKRMYFIQPIKEPVTASETTQATLASLAEEPEPEETRAEAPAEEEE
ncbi:MAG TPA: hypothetical protein EYP14_00365 [Planctomycetaceae bacterium]|nr:hypothetical protein [Planctomycetaceae bacterium]